MADRDDGFVFDADNLKVGEYLKRWLVDSVLDTVRPTTYERYEQIIRIHVRPALGGVKLKNLTPVHVRGLNATEAVKAPQVRRQEISPLSAEQVKVLLETTCGDRLEALFVLAIHTGLRQGELLGLKWEDVDLESGTFGYAEPSPPPRAARC